MAVDDYNRRAIAALERARSLSGTRSATAFARLLAEHASGSPSPSTYRRWISGEAVIPAWAVEVAAEVAGTTVQGLLEDDRQPGLDEWRSQIDNAVGRLEGEIIELRRHLGLDRQRSGGDSKRENAHTRLAT